NNYNFINKCFQNSIKLDKVRDMGNNVCMIVHEDKEFWILNRISSGKKRRLIYSMCDIYLSDKFKNYLAGQNIDILKIHHSGHATRETLSAFINAMKPKQLIPVHTFAPDMFKEIDFRGIFAEN
ncbi:hypothetical protein KA977_01955, partial [Candidatus Dependentiae bacterium]|nr:hypothetical protein [Candidatus Dependentiae bacterium]